MLEAILLFILCVCIYTLGEEKRKERYNKTNKAILGRIKERR